MQKMHVSILPLVAILLPLASACCPRRPDAPRLAPVVVRPELPSCPPEPALPVLATQDARFDDGRISLSESTYREILIRDSALVAAVRGLRLCVAAMRAWSTVPPAPAATPD